MLTSKMALDATRDSGPRMSREVNDGGASSPRRRLGKRITPAIPNAPSKGSATNGPARRPHGGMPGDPHAEDSGYYCGHNPLVQRGNRDSGLDHSYQDDDEDRQIHPSSPEEQVHTPYCPEDLQGTENQEEEEAVYGQEPYRIPKASAL